MRVVGIGVADAVDDGHFAGVVEALDGAHVGVKAQMIVDRQDLVGGDVDRRPIVVI